jgi:hypothetical protein
MITPSSVALSVFDFYLKEIGSGDMLRGLLAQEGINGILL